MKKLTTLFFGLMIFIASYADGNWATSAIYITVDGDDSTFTMYDDAGWTDGDWLTCDSINAWDFGSPSSLILAGAAGNGWASGGDYYDGTSFVLFYRVYQTGTIPTGWDTLRLHDQTYLSGNNYIYKRTGANVDLLSLATVEGTNDYILEVMMSKNQYYSGGSWNSIVPGGQSVVFSEDSTGYKATFSHTYTATQIVEKEIDDCKIFVCESGVKIGLQSSINQNISISIINLAGQICANCETYVVSGDNTINMSQNFESGIYLVQLRIGEERLVKKIAIQ